MMPQMNDPAASPSDLTRYSLIARASRSEAGAWRDLVELYEPLVNHWCRRCDLDLHSAADCVQDTFAAVARGLERFEHPQTGGAFRGWLWTIARNKIRDHQRRMRRQSRGAGGSTAMRWFRDLSGSVALPQEDPTDQVQWDQLVRRAVAQVQAEFEPRSWQAFWQSAVEGVATAVVAAELGVTAASVRQSRSRILRRLRQQLGDCP